MGDLREEIALVIQAELERQWEAKEGRWLEAMPIADCILANPQIAEALRIREAVRKHGVTISKDGFPGITPAAAPSPRTP